MIQSWIRLLIICYVALFSSFLSAQSDKKSIKKQSIFQFIKNETSLRVEIATNIDSLLINKLKPYEARGLVSFLSDSSKVTLPVKISVRGKFRRRTCDFPPLLLDFPKDDLKDFGFKKADKYKLVTHCLHTKNAKNYLFKEYLIYQFYKQLDSTGFDVVLFPITYRDVESDFQIESYAFLIESQDELEDRLNGKWCDCLGIAPDSINAYYRELVNFFQYMIGNRDMNMHIEHNIRFIEGGPFSKKVPIPYDFDFADFVKTPYAFPDQSITFDRSTLPPGKNANEFEKVLSLFIHERDSFLKIINAFPLLSKRHKRKSKSFIKEFYRLIERPYFKKQYLTT